MVNECGLFLTNWEPATPRGLFDGEPALSVENGKHAKNAALVANGTRENPPERAALNRTSAWLAGSRPRRTVACRVLVLAFV
jgi:hypothetical protein